MFTILAPIVGFSRFDSHLPNIPFEKEHVLIIVILVISSCVSFWISKITFNSLRPIIRIVNSIGLLQGIFLSGVISIHFSNYMMQGIGFPLLGFELLAPFMSFFIFCRQYYFYSKVRIYIEEQLPYRVELGLIPWQYKIFYQHGISKLIIYSVFVFAMVASQMLIACFIGVDLDAIIKAFTHSTGFVFSRY